MASSPSPRSSPRLNPTTTVSPSTTSNEQSRKSSFVPAWRRPTLVDSGSSDGRRPSVQFIPQTTTDGASSNPHSRSSSAQPTGSRITRPPLAPPGGASGRRLSSPPPPAQFRNSVSFDTFNNKEASDFSLTLVRKHKDYEYTKRSRTFLCGTDTNEYSDTALEWLIDELVDDGDEVVCLRVVEKDSKEALKWSGGLGEKGYRREAERFLDGIEKKNTEDRAISLILEFSIGKVQETIQQMIRIYEPAMLVVGTRGRSLTGYAGLLSSGSVSKYCLQYSPVPVIVVRPSSKREAKKRKRLKDPDRTGYRDILDKSEDVPRGRGGHLLDAQNRRSVVGPSYGALGELGSAGDPDHEARMVAEVIGYQQPPPRASTPLGGRRESSLSRVASGDSTRGRRRDSSLSRMTSGDSGEPGVLLKSPELQTLDSPEVSDDEAGLDGAEEEEILRPEDEAARLAYERALQTMEEEKEEAEARAKREAERSASRGRVEGKRMPSRKRDDGNEEGRGAAVLGMLAQLERGVNPHHG